MKSSKWCFWLLSLVFSSLLCAQALPRDAVPEPLAPWIDWVLLDHPDYPCPFPYNRFEPKRCAWPSRLSLDLDTGSASFSIEAEVFAKSWVQLPGDPKIWPVKVSVNQNPALVMQRRNAPFIQLGPGKHLIQGHFIWDFIPDNLPIPGDTGLIELKLKGQAVDFPLVRQGRLWLRGGERKKAIEDRLELEVFRRIEDEVPLQMLSRLEFKVAGKNRELKLALAMRENFLPMRLSSPLPARIDGKGNLLLQLRPGNWRIELQSRHLGPAEQLTLNSPASIWPRREIWVFAARPHLRLVEIEDLRAIDPQLTNLPENWKHLPAYQIERGQSMKFKVLRRGDPEPEPNRLQIERSFWLDFDGRGYTVNDRISGRMTRSWRLNALPGTHLGKVSFEGKDQLITRLQGSQQNGIEVRKGDLHLNADSRIEAPIANINAVGWDQSFHRAHASLNLPPGWRLLAARGVDQVPGSWVSRWTLLDLFLVLVTALATARLWNAYWGLLALLTLALIWHEADAPRWIWLNLLAATALLRVLPKGRLFRLIGLYSYASGAVLLIILIPFSVEQLRSGLYPQLERPGQPITPSAYREPTMPAASLASSAKPSAKMAAPQRELFKADQAVELEVRAHPESEKFKRIDPDAKIQTGPGLPNWQWTHISLDWNGPVDSGQEIRFWYLSPGTSRILNFLRVLLALLLAGRLLGIVKRKIRANPGLPGALIGLFCMLSGSAADAALPDTELLDELKFRLLREPDCLPSCAQIGRMTLEIDAAHLAVELEVDVAERVAFPLPGRALQWLPRQVSVHERDFAALYRDRNGSLWIHLDPGHSVLRLEGKTPSLNRFSLFLPLNPHRIEVKAEHWLVEGIQEHRSPEGQIQFSRERGDALESMGLEAEAESLPGFVRIERTLQLGLDWQVETRVIRMTPDNTPVVLEVPLLPGESVTTADIRVREAKVLVNLRPGQQELRWLSLLPIRPEILLQAPLTPDWVEVWRVDLSPIWHLQSEGIAVVHHQDGQGRWLPEWRPWPGESLRLFLQRPKAVPGSTLTIDRAQVEIKPGDRLRESTLTMTIRSSQGAQHAIRLPEHAILQSVSLDGGTQPIRAQGRTINLPLRPGSQEIQIRWREHLPISMKLITPELDLGAGSVNTSLSIVLGRDRWTLWPFGPAFGPAVLFWGFLIVILALSFALGRISISPLQFHQWFLLLLGLSQIPVAASLIVIAWILIPAYRREHSAQNPHYFNAAQIGIALLSLFALGLLFIAINQGLLGSPDMQVSGNHSSAFHLNWYQDKSPAILPQAGVISVPMLCYRLLMLAWSLWLAVSLLNWLKFTWECFSSEGLWKKTEPKKIVAADSKTS